MCARGRIRGDPPLCKTAPRSRHFRYHLLLKRLGANPPSSELGARLGHSHRARAQPYQVDSLGLEYGRLGSAVFVACEKRAAAAKHERLEGLAREMRKAVRLFGGAALPAHFPPYVGTTAYRTLTDRRIAAILRNSRRTARYFACALAGSSAELHFAHGLYVTLAPKRILDEKQIKQLAADLCGDLRKAGLPLRHAGSFGFDFGAAEWFRDTTRNRYVVRVAVPDLPMPLWDQIARAVVQWWSESFAPLVCP
jgi:hypothetical protein